MAASIGQLLKIMRTRIKRLLLVIKTTRNWQSALLVWFGLTKQCTAKFRGGHTFLLDRKSWVNYLECVYLFHHFPRARLVGTKVEFTYNSRKLIFNVGKYGLGTILEIFGGDPYRDFLRSTNIKGKQVVDIGAAFGDTAISFLLEGAKHVYAIEAFPGYFRLAEENIKANGFSDSCDVLLSAAGGSPGVMTIDHNLAEMFGAGIEKSEIGDKVPILTLEQIVERFNIEKGILKLDVEGYEYEILLSASKGVLRRFSDMVIEYHYGFEKLENHLRDAGFSVTHTPPHLVYMPQLEGEAARNMFVGNIYATLK